MSAISLRLFIPGICALALLACACRRPANDDTEVVFSLDPEFTIDLFEERNPSNGAAVFGMWVESMASFDCNNYTIKGSATLHTDLLEIRLEDISAPDTCIGDPGRARGFIPIGPLADGLYRFRVLRNLPIVNEGTLLVENGHYELSLAKEQDIVFQNRVLESLPQGYVWGYALAPMEQDLPQADQFLATLKPLTAEPLLPPGFYSYFTVSGTGQYFFHSSIAPKGQHRPFLRRFSGDPDALRALLKSYREDPVRPLEIRCKSTQGDY